jgi:hypothetical protein
MLDAKEAIEALDASAADKILGEIEAVKAQPVDHVAESAAELEPTHTPTQDALDTRTAIFWLLDRYWSIAMLAIIVVVVAAGAWTQYIENDAFRGSLRDWVSLVIFGLAAQVTTSTVTEALGKLTPSSTVSK